MSEFVIHALRYATLSSRRASENFLGGDAHDGPMPLDYFVWTLQSDTHTLVVDTGFDEDTAVRRGRQIVRPVGEALDAVGIDHRRIDDVIVTHMHYDHCGNHGLFPKARFHVQDREMQYCTGRCMCHRPLRQFFEVADVKTMVERVFAGRVQFHEGVGEVVPDVSVHWVGGHTQGMQVVRVRTKRGWVVLASDASHFYANFEEDRPFPGVYNVAEMLEGYRAIRALASSEDHIIPGHDPLVLARYPDAGKGPGIVRLDLPPRAITG
jgi:glyoxylase-like metal-dependent hydrolase (beta-lactamase superfamily II)